MTTVHAPLTDYQRSTYLSRAPLTVACAFCGQPRGADCESSGGYVVPFHDPRRVAVRHMSTDDRVAAYAELVEERRQLRAEADAHMASLETDPVYVANRAATRAMVSAAWDSMKADQLAEERDFRSRCTDEPFRLARTHADDCHCRLDGVVVSKPVPVGVARGTLPVTYLSDRGRRDG